MGKRIDITGQTFNNWRVHNRIDGSTYDCECLLCGNHYPVTSYKLRKGLSRSCAVCAIDNTRQKKQIKNKYNEAILKLIKGNNIMYNTEDIVENIKFDIYLPDKKCAINVIKTEDNLDSKRAVLQNNIIACAKQGIHLFNIFEYELKDVNTFNKILEMLRIKLDDTYAKKIYARNTKIERRENTEIVKFLKENHLQGYVAADINLVLVYEGEVIGLMSFGRPRFNKDFEYELIRLAFKRGIKVIGGSEKLFKHFIKEFKPKSILSYCSITKFYGRVYTKLGFKADGFTTPNYMWVKDITNDVLPRYKTMKHKLIEKGYGTYDMTENEIMRHMGYSKVYDGGNLKLAWYTPINNI